MTDKALQNAEEKKKQLVARRLELNAQITEIDRQIGQVDAFVKAWHAFAEGGVDVPVDISTTIRENKPEPTATKTTGNSPRQEVADMARALILEREGPIMRDELYDLLTSEGLVIQGKDPKMVLSTMLWRSKDQIVRVKGGGYWAADIPNKEIGYDPAETSDFEQALNTPVEEVPDPDIDSLI